jgi:carbamate kinase
VRVVVALGGNALLRRGERPDADVQEHNVELAVASLAPLADEHELVVTHGNGPQVGVLAIESESDPALTAPYPLDSLGAETQGLIGYWLVHELQNALPDRTVVALVTRTVVDARDPAFSDPTKFVGPTYGEHDARRLAATRGWTVAPDGAHWRRVVASPLPVEIVEIDAVRLLLAEGAVVVCAGGGGVPVVGEPGARSGAEAVIDKDLTAALLAESLTADALLVLTDVDAVVAGFGTPDARSIRRATTSELRAMSFPPGSMGPKIDAVCRFVERTGGIATIASLTSAGPALRGEAGTRIVAA